LGAAVLFETDFTVCWLSRVNGPAIAGTADAARLEAGGHCRSSSMGLLTILKKQKEKEKEMRLLMLGLDNAGKTTIVKKFNGEDVDTIAPTLGFNIKTLECVRTRTTGSRPRSGPSLILVRAQAPTHPWPGIAASS
jgi:hypothetical protein